MKRCMRTVAGFVGALAFPVIGCNGYGDSSDTSASEVRSADAGAHSHTGNKPDTTHGSGGSHEHGDGGHGGGGHGSGIGPQIHACIHAAVERFRASIGDGGRDETAHTELENAIQQCVDTIVTQHTGSGDRSDDNGGEDDAGTEH
jgi:hypothetical protein